MLKIATWNLWWAGPKSARLDAIRDQLDCIAPDVAVLTEVNLDAISSWHHRPDAGQHPRVRNPKWRKVAIVSHLPTKVVDDVGSLRLPPNNFLAVDVETAAGSVRVIGIVVRYNQKTEYVNALPEALKATVTDRTVLAGDFNLKIPGGRLSKRLVAVLGEAGLEVRTSGDHDSLTNERSLIDHIAVSPSLTTSEPEVWPRFHPRFAGGKKQQSDHAGCALRVQWAAA